MHQAREHVRRLIVLSWIPARSVHIHSVAVLLSFARVLIPFWQSALLKAMSQRGLDVKGCTHPVSSHLVNGLYTETGSNHGRVMYTKVIRAPGLKSFMYYWDQQDGPNLQGWWIGPEVGGHTAWAYNAQKSSEEPPKDGWLMVPGWRIDETLIVSEEGTIPATR